MNWKNILYTVVVFILGNVVCVIGYFHGVSFTSPPDGSGSVMVYAYAFFTIFTFGAIPGITSVALFFAFRRLLDSRHFVNSSFFAMVSAMSATYVLGIVFGYLMIPARILDLFV